MKVLLIKINKIIQSILGCLKKTKVKAVYEDDLKKMIESLGIATGIENGVYKCKYCGSRMSFENLQAILKEKGEIKFVCFDLKCFSKII